MQGAALLSETQSDNRSLVSQAHTALRILHSCLVWLVSAIFTSLLDSTHCMYTVWSGAHGWPLSVYTLGHMVGHPRLPIQPLWNLSCCRRPTHPQFLLRNTNTFWNTNTFDKYKSLGCWFSPCITWTNLELISPQKFLGVDWINISYFKAFCYLILGDGVWSSALINTPAG